MMYQADFVLAIIHQGSPVREINNTIHLPFNSEYKIRLKNKNHGLRAKVKVWVDGRLASGLGDLVLNSNQTLDLERFLDHDLNTGNKFKFVSLSDSKVNDPTDDNNGIIKVEFYKEQTWRLNISSWPQPWPYPPNPKKPYKGFETIWDTNPGDFTDQVFVLHNLCSTNLIGSTSLTPTGGYGSRSQPGATVEGGVSNQKFITVEDFTTDLVPTTLTLKIRGIDNSYSPVEKNKSAEKERFCSNCGKHRHKMGDKFCPRCGNKY